MGAEEGGDEATILGNKDVDRVQLGSKDTLGEDENDGFILSKNDLLGAEESVGSKRDDGVDDGKRILGPADGIPEVSLLDPSERQPTGAINWVRSMATPKRH